MSKLFYVYGLKDSYGKFFYIGKGSGKRMYKHYEIAVSNYPSRRNKNPKLYNKIIKILSEGDKFTPEIIFTSHDETICLKEEVKLIKELGKNNLCNLTDGGEGTSGFRYTENQKRIRYEKRYGKPYEQKSLKKQKLETGRKNYWHGKSLSMDTRNKMSLAKKNKIFSDEHKCNLSKALIGRKLSDTHKKNISISNTNKNKDKPIGFKLTNEHKTKLSLSLNGGVPFMTYEEAKLWLKTNKPNIKTKQDFVEFKKQKDFPKSMPRHAFGKYSKMKCWVSWKDFLGK